MRQRRPRGLRGFMSFCIGVIITTVAAVILAAVYLQPPAVQALLPASFQEKRTTSPTTDGLPSEKPEVAAGRRENFFTLLLAGTDEDGTRTDTIMLVALDTAAGTVSVLNIPRDTRAYMEGGSVHKINAAHNRGIDRMLAEIEATVGFAPDRYCIIDFSVFETVIDAIGGVTVDVAMDMYYEDPDQDLIIDIPAGEQRLDGEQALHYMRYRSGYADADLGRIRAQQELLQALADQIMSIRSLALLPKLPSILSDIETDLSIGECVWLSTQLFGLNAENMTTDMLPGEPSGADYAADEEAVLALVNERFNPYLAPITKLNIP